MEISKRDRECLETIELYGAMTTKQIIKEVYNNSYSVGTRRLRNMEKEGYIGGYIKKKRISTGEQVYYVCEEKEVYNKLESADLLMSLKEEGYKIKKKEEREEGEEVIELKGVERKLILIPTLSKEKKLKDYREEKEGKSVREYVIVLLGGIREREYETVYDYVVYKGDKKDIEEIKMNIKEDKGTE